MDRPAVPAPKAAATTARDIRPVVMTGVRSRRMTVWR